METCSHTAITTFASYSFPIVPSARHRERRERIRNDPSVKRLDPLGSGRTAPRGRPRDVRDDAIYEGGSTYLLREATRPRPADDSVSRKYTVRRATDRPHKTVKVSTGTRGRRYNTRTPENTTTKPPRWHSCPRAFETCADEHVVVITFITVIQSLVLTAAADRRTIMPTTPASCARSRASVNPNCRRCVLYTREQPSVKCARVQGVRLQLTHTHTHSFDFRVHTRRRGGPAIRRLHAIVRFDDSNNCIRLLAVL